MQSGWVAAATDSNTKFFQLDKEDEEEKMSVAESDVYYCGDEDGGHAKKNKWLKTWLPYDTNEEEDDKEWFWFDKEGKLFYRMTTGAQLLSEKRKLTPKITGSETMV